jgi:hypothetical protein
VTLEDRFGPRAAVRAARILPHVKSMAMGAGEASHKPLNLPASFFDIALESGSVFYPTVESSGLIEAV